MLITATPTAPPVGIKLSKEERTEVWDHVRGYHQDLRFADVLKERYSVSLKETRHCPSDGTAYWYYTLYPKPGQHNIVLCETLFNTMDPKADRSLAPKFAEKHYDHEVAHGEFTCRDMIIIRKRLKDRDVPFEVYNLFEDARIEHKWRLKFHKTFDWAEMQVMPPVETPHQIFFGLIFTEGKAWSDIKDKPLYDKVYTYYKRTIDVSDKDCLRVIDIAAEFLKEFPLPKRLVFGFADLLFFLDSCYGTRGGDEKIELDQDLCMPLIGGGELGSNEPRDVLVGPVAENSRVDKVSNHKILDENFEGDLDLDEVRELHKQLSRSMKGAKGRVYVAEPRKRISVRHYVRQAPNFYRGEAPDTRTKPREVSLIIDCSGSMNCLRGGPIGAARVMTAVLNRLAREARITGQVMLSRMSGSNSQYEVFELGFRDKDVRGIPANGSGEGLNGTLHANVKQVLRSDYVFVFTDGNITDDAVDKDYWAKRGKKIYGLYVGSGDQTEELRRYFHHVISRESVVSLGEALAQMIKLDK